MQAQSIVVELQAIVESCLGSRSGTFKLAAVNEEFSRARQQARAQLSDTGRQTVTEAMRIFTDWVIERDPEAAARVASGAHPPQDVTVAVRAAEDLAIALAAEGLDASHVAVLRARLGSISVETVEERQRAGKPRLRWSNSSVKLMAAGLGVILAAAGTTAASEVVGLGGTFLGAAVFVVGFRRWKSGEGRSNVAAAHVLRGGTMGRKWRQSL